MIKLKYQDKLLPILNEYNLTLSSRQVSFNNMSVDFTGKNIIDLPYKYQEASVVETEYVTKMGREEKETSETKFTNGNGDNLYKLDITGNTTQETTTGKNLLDNILVSGTQNGITAVVNKDKSVTINGTATKQVDLTFLTSRLNFEAGKYTFSISKTGKSGVVMQYGVSGVGLMDEVNSTTKYVTTFPNNIKGTNYSYISVFRVRISSGTSLSNYTIYPQILKGEYTDQTMPDYEPYTNGASPNPDYPQEIKTVKSWNIFNTEFEQGARNNTDGSSLISSANYIRTKDKIEVKPSTTYTIKSVSAKSVNGGDIHYYDRSMNFISRDSIVINSTKTTPSNCYYINIQYYLSTGIAPSDIETTMINKGSEKPYTPYNNIGVKITGKNKAHNTIYSATTSQYAVILSADADLEPNTTYTISFKGTTGNKIYFNENMFVNNYWNTEILEGTTSITMTTKPTLDKGNASQYANNRWILIKNAQAQTNANSFEEVQIEKGTQATPYEPYKEAISYIDLKGNELCKIGETKDELDIINGKLIKRIGKVVLNGSESWTKSSSYVGAYWLSSNYCGRRDNTYYITNYFTSTTKIGDYKKSTCYTGDGAFDLWLGDSSEYTTLADFKTWLSSNNVEVYYILATPQEIDIDTTNVKTLVGDNNIDFLSVEQPYSQDVGYYIPKPYEAEEPYNTLFTGYVNNFTLPSMKLPNEKRTLQIELLSPMKLATLRTCSAIGTYDLKDLIDIIVEPLILDGYTLKEVNIGEHEVSVNYLLETCESALNKLSNKYNFWWYINEKKEIFISDISSMINNEPKLIYNGDLKGLYGLTPSADATDYCNVVNFTNVRVYRYSYYLADLNEYKPFIDRTMKIKKDDYVEFIYPIDLNALEKSYESQPYKMETYKDTILEINYTNASNQTGQLYIKKINGVITLSSNAQIGDSDNTETQKTWILERDSFFSNLIVGAKYTGTSTITTIGDVFTNCALMWCKYKLINNKEIAKMKGIISATGIVEKTIDMNETWKTSTELIDIANSYIKTTNKQIDEVQLKLDENYNLEIGDMVEINKPEFMIQDKFIITDITKVLKGIYYTWLITLKNSNYLENFVDLFRASETEQTEEKLYNEIISNYDEEQINEVHEVA